VVSSLSYSLQLFLFASMEVMPLICPKLRLDIELHKCAFGENLQAVQEYWLSVSSSFELLISDMLWEQPVHIGEFMKDWLSKPRHQPLLTPSVVKANKLKVGDSVMAKFYGEWYPAKVHTIDNDEYIIVLWEAEWSTSRIPVADVTLRESERTIDTMAAQLGAQSMEKTHPMPQNQTNLEHVDPNRVPERPSAKKSFKSKKKELPHNPNADSDSKVRECALQEKISNMTWSERLVMDPVREPAAIESDPRQTPLQGTLSKMRNGTAVSASPLTPARASGVVEPQSQFAVAVAEWHTEIDVQSEVRTFVASSNLDKEAIDSFSKLEPEVQEIVMRRGSLSSAHNPSAALHARIREAYVIVNARSSEKKGVCLAKRVKAFLSENPVDDRAANALLSAKPNVQEHVLSRGSLISAKNPSGALMSRLGEAQKSKA